MTSKNRKSMFDVFSGNNFDRKGPLTETVFGPSQVYAKTERDLSKEYQRAALDEMDE